MNKQELTKVSASSRRSPFNKTPLFAALLLALPSSAAFAQDDEIFAALEEVVVTATKRAASIQDVPLSISAVSGEKLEAAGIQDFDDLAASVPSLSFKSSGPGRTKLNIRGISAATGFAPTVSYYIDEMPISSVSSGSSTSFAQAVISPKLFDLDRVEVLRGPQGTLFGSSSMGGTVRLITGQPNLDEFEGKVGAEVSSTSGGGLNMTVNGMANVVLSEKAALRVVGSKTDNNGYIDREFAGGMVENVNTEETESFRASLRYQLTDDTWVQPAIFTQTMDMDGKPNTDGPTYDDRQVRPFDGAEPFNDEFTMTSLTMGSDFEKFSLTANFSRMDRDFVNVEDMTDAVDFLGQAAIFGYGDAPSAAFVDEDISLRDETFEVRLASTTADDFQWVLGIYNKSAEVNADYRMGRGFEYVTDRGLANTNDRSSYDESAVFGEGSLAFADDFTFTLGLRYLDYSFSQHKEDWGYVYNPGAGGLAEGEASTLDVSASDQEMNYRATLMWNFSEDGQMFVTSSDATRPGGGNRSIPRSTDPSNALAYACDQDLNALGITGNPTSYAGDSVENLEIGIKVDPTSNLRINASAYRIVWSDIQQRVSTSGTCGFNFTANVGEAVSTGFEAEVTAVVNENFSINAGLGYTQAEFSETVAQANVNDGDLLPDVPELTTSVTFDYSTALETGEVFFLGTISYVDETLELPGSANTDTSGESIDSGNVKPSYTMIDARIGYDSGDNWEAALFVDNLTDEVAYYSYNDAIVVNVPGFDRTARNRPRTVGISANMRF